MKYSDSGLEERDNRPWEPVATVRLRNKNNGVCILKFFGHLYIYVNKKTKFCFSLLPRGCLRTPALDFNLHLTKSAELRASRVATST
jgi:hypothetical protein